MLADSELNFVVGGIRYVCLLMSSRPWCWVANNFDENSGDTSGTPVIWVLL